MQAELLELTGIWHFKQATVTHKPTMGQRQHLQGRKKSTGTNTLEIIRAPGHKVINSRSHLFPWAECKECEAILCFCMKGDLLVTYCQRQQQPNNEQIIHTSTVCVALHWCSQTVRHASVSHIVTLGDMFLHYHKHGHRSLFYVDPTYTVLLQRLPH